MLATGLGPYPSRQGLVEQAPIVCLSSWYELQRRIWRNHFNRHHQLSDHEIAYMPWIAQVRPPASWIEFVQGVSLARRHRPTKGVLHRQYEFAYPTAIAYGVPVDRWEDGCLFTVPGWPALYLDKDGEAGPRRAIWLLTSG